MSQKTIHTHTFHTNFWSSKRVERNIPIKKIATAINRSTGTTGSYFTGKTLPDDKIITTICEMFDVPFSEGKDHFIEDHDLYVASRRGLAQANSEDNPEYEADPLKNKVIKKYHKRAVAVEVKSNHKVKHETVWRKRLNAAGITSAEFAKYLSKDKSTVVKYISGKNMPPKEVVQMFADYFKVPYTQAAEEFRVAYEQFNHIERKKPKQLVNIETSSEIALPTYEVNKTSKEKPLSKKAENALMKTLYGKLDAETFMTLMNKGKISESKLRELYINLDFETFMNLSKFLKR